MQRVHFDTDAGLRYFLGRSEIFTVFWKWEPRVPHGPKSRSVVISRSEAKRLVIHLIDSPFKNFRRQSVYMLKIRKINFLRIVIDDVTVVIHMEAQIFQNCLKEQLVNDTDCRSRRRIHRDIDFTTIQKFLRQLVDIIVEQNVVHV